MRPLEAFLRELDAAWAREGAAPVRLRLIGSAALLLRTDYARGTKDSDVLETAEVDPAVRERLVGLAGPGTDLHRRHRLYVDVVARSLPRVERDFFEVEESEIELPGWVEDDHE